MTAKMIKNLVIGGCSFSDSRDHPTWATHVSRALNATEINLARSGAGNIYICHSIIDCLWSNKFDPDETLVLVMWSGSDRHDMLVSGEYWYLLEDYPCKTTYGDPDGYWVFSGGRSNAWLDHAETKKLFKYYYLSTDPFVMCKQTLSQIDLLETYLQKHGFHYRFMSHVNYWNTDSDCQSVIDGVFNMPFFCRSFAHFQQLRFDNWIFMDEENNGIYEFCRDRRLLGIDDFHPSSVGHKLFADQIIIPNLEENLL